LNDICPGRQSVQETIVKRKPSMVVHQLPEIEEEGISPSYEYRLPTVELPDESRKFLGPWLSSLIGKKPAEIRESLRARWTGRSIPLVQPILDVLMEYKPTAIVTHDERAWLLCKHSDGRRRSETTYLIPDPVDAKQLQERLDQSGFSNPVLLDFLAAISGLREDFEPNSRGFLRLDEEWNRLDDPSWETNLENYADWRGSLFIYGSDTGNGLCVHQGSRVGWLTGDGCVSDFASDMTEFCEKYVDYRRTIVSPASSLRLIRCFDAYWPQETGPDPPRFRIV